MTQECPKAVLFAIDTGRNLVDTADSLAELAELADSAGVTVVGKIVQRRDTPDTRTYLGEGKLNELVEMMRNTHADVAICDDELTPAQAGHISDAVDGRVVDRTQLILDIFASRANSKEGKVQVELAQLRYLLPRLTGQGAEMSRLGAGIGTRGPGETKLETDRRHVRHRMAELRRELNQIRQRRNLQRAARRAADTPMVALVGYTNAGKSTLLNTLTGAQVLAENRLFATLDPTIRGVELPQGETALFVDTVGFIRKLPHDLVAAFRATLEEVQEADVLVHVVDCTHPQMESQMAAVAEVLTELGAADKPIVTAYNKTDQQEPAVVEALTARTSHACAISALNGDGLDALVRLVGEVLPERHVTRTYAVPYSEGRVVSWLHEQGRVVSEEYQANAINVTVELRRSMADRVRQYELPQSALPSITKV